MTTKRISSKLTSYWLEDGLLISEYYKRKIGKYSIDSVASLDWRSPESHALFLESALSGIDIEKVKSVLDVGCGRGDLFDHLEKITKEDFRYTGIDIVPGFISKALNSKDNRDMKVEVGNFIDERYWPKDRSDLVINLGGLASQVRFYRQYLKYNIEKMILLSNRYVIFNIITDISPDYFPGKSSRKKVGKIGGCSEVVLKNILEQIKKKHRIEYRIKKVTIFEGSRDAFVYIKI